MRLSELLRRCLRDLRLACRHLIAAPGYTAAAAVTLGLAIGANSAIFGAVRAVLLAPMAIRDPGSLVLAWEADPTRNLAIVEVTYRNFERWRAASGSFSRMAVMGSSAWPAVLEDPDAPVKLALMGVSASFFDTLGAAPMLGRVLHADDDRPHAAPVAVVSHHLWTTRLGGDPAIVGQTLRLAGKPVTTIVGVMPPGFDFPRGTDIWVPVVPVLANASNDNRLDALEHVGVLFVLGRLRPGVTAAAARADLDTIVRRLPGATGASSRPAAVPIVAVTPFLEHAIGPVRHALWWLLGAVAVLLLIACANVSGLMLTRAALRRREHAIRLALGASRAALGRLWASEAIVLALIGGLLGLIASRWIAAAIVALAPSDIPRLSRIAIDLPVAGFTCLAVLAAALLCGLGPVLQARASNLVDALNDAARGSSGARSVRARALLVTAQIGLAVVLLIAAGLVIRSFLALRQLDLGFDPRGVVAMEVQPRDPKGPDNDWLQALLTRVAALPDVEAAGSVRLRPLVLGPVGQEAGVLLEGQPETSEAVRRNPMLNHQIVTPGYFRAMRIPVTQGREFSVRDDRSHPRVVLLGESAARRLFPGQDPIGRTLSLPSFTPTGPRHNWRTIVGVVRDVRYRGLDDVRLDVYEAALQSDSVAGHVVVRTSGDPVTLAAAIQAEARRADPLVLIGGVTTMEAVVARAMAPWRFSSWLFTLFAALAFLLAAVGLFGVVSLDVVHRSREFAVRLALGAQRRDITRRVLRSAAWRVLSGVSLGLLAALVLARWMRSLLFAVEPLDPITYVIVITLVLVIVSAASLLPARRAARIDPLTLLKRD